MQISRGTHVSSKRSDAVVNNTGISLSHTHTGVRRQSRLIDRIPDATSV